MSDIQEIVHVAAQQAREVATIAEFRIRCRHRASQSHKKMLYKTTEKLQTANTPARPAISTLQERAARTTNGVPQTRESPYFPSACPALPYNHG